MVNPSRRDFGIGLQIASVAPIIIPFPTQAKSAPLFADIALCFACDVSGSVNNERYELQKNGLAKALTSDIMKKRLETISVAMIYQEWSDTSKFSDWFLVRNIQDATIFANTILEFERSSSANTYVADAIVSAIAMLNACPYEVGRKVIDVSGDGPDKDLSKMPIATSAAIESGIQINGLPIVTIEEPNLYAFYEDFVKTGPGSFVIQADGFEDFERAMMKKVIGDMG